ncbi:Tubulin polyglutamylase TTLL11 (Tubulin--tyrosine ligase-like protein 11) [Durusdinium trenchii]|uniref:Tubulin polyglutamylase TTLL11 (Tubulin--tyrosine ligase-like protein 11) n=1 Tax=Durusdinium trenchii TaxID=1381693 RepID=A0ABP0M8Q5_9DINO
MGQSIAASRSAPDVEPSKKDPWLPPGSYAIDPAKPHRKPSNSCTRIREDGQGRCCGRCDGLWCFEDFHDVLQDASAPDLAAWQSFCVGRPRKERAAQRSEENRRKEPGIAQLFVVKAGQGFVVNTSDCVGKSSKDLFSYVAASLGWKEVDLPDAKVRPSIFCVMQSADLLKRLPLSPQSWASRYLGAPDVCDKGNFARMLRATRSLCSEDYFSFSPKTWVLPEELTDLRSTLEKSKGTFIVKPEDGSQGDGIFLVRGLRNFDVKISTQAPKAVVQKYISKPLLLGSLKFDLRMYVLVAGGCSDSPPVVQLCREGLARFCTEAYESWHHEHSPKALRGLQPLTYIASQLETLGAKVLIALGAGDVKEYPDFNPDAFYHDVQVIAQRSLALMAPVLLSGSRPEAGSERRLFQIFGFDIMLDNKYKAYLLEVNNSPSLCIDEALPVDGRASELDGRASKTREKDTRQSYIPVPFDAELWPLLARLEQLYSRSGGVKSFSSTALRRIFEPLCGAQLQKHDLDLLAQRCRSSSFVGHDKAARPDALRFFEPWQQLDFVEVLIRVGERAFGRGSPRELVERTLKALDT